MASRSISAILWSLVSVNFLTLIVGGLTTWLGYTIPVRLKQAGLLPEFVIVAGSASLVIACIGICALNYSSANMLNIYACSCTLLILMLVFGIPDVFYKSNYFVNGTLLLDIIYYTLLFLLSLLVVFAIILGQYLRSKELSTTELAASLYFPSNQTEQRSHLLSLAAPEAATAGSSHLQHQSTTGHATSKGECTCHVMITPPTAAGGSGRDDDDDNNNNNQNRDANTRCSGNSTIMNRWFSRLKPQSQSESIRKLSAIARSREHLDPQNNPNISASFNDNNARYMVGRGNNADHYLAAATTTKRGNLYPYQSSSSFGAINCPYNRSPTTLCSCGAGGGSSRQLHHPNNNNNNNNNNSLETQSADTRSSLPPLVSRGIYRQQRQQQPRRYDYHEQQQQQRTHDNYDDMMMMMIEQDRCRSAGNLCSNSQELLVDDYWPIAQDDHDVVPLTSQEDDDEEEEAEVDTSMNQYGAGWQRQQPARQRRCHQRSFGRNNNHKTSQQQQQQQQQQQHHHQHQHHERRASNANYRQAGEAAAAATTEVAGLRCNCNNSSSMSIQLQQQQQQQQHSERSPYTLPMINSSSSVYSISGLGCRTGATTTTTTKPSTTPNSHRPLRPLAPLISMKASSFRLHHRPPTKAHSSSSVVAMTAAAAAVAALFGGSAMDGIDQHHNDDTSFFAGSGIYNDNNCNGLEETALIDITGRNAYHQ